MPVGNPVGNNKKEVFLVRNPIDMAERPLTILAVFCEASPKSAGEKQTAGRAFTAVDRY